jgi:hypothetical protein
VGLKPFRHSEVVQQIAHILIEVSFELFHDPVVVVLLYCSFYYVGFLLLPLTPLFAGITG